MTEDLFSETAPTDVNLRDELLNKWKEKSADEVLKAKVDSDLYVKTLERRLDEMRTDYTKAVEDSKATAKLQELIDRFEKQRDNSSNEDIEVKEEKPAFDPRELDNFFDRKFQESEAKRRESENYKSFVDKVKEKYGEHFQTSLKEQVENLGLSQEDVLTMARKSPQVLVKALGLDQTKQETFQAPIRSNKRSDNFAPSVQKRTWSYYQSLKKSDPKTYNDPKTTVQMHNDAVELGEAFKDGDYRIFGD